MPVPKLSEEEYLEIDRAAEVPSEYLDGKMFPIEAVTYEHSRVSVKISRWFDEKLQGTPCAVAASPLRVRVSPAKYVVPDHAIVCGSPVFADFHRDTLTNPKVIIEILSPSTGDYDQGTKFALYCRLQSFVEYILVSQDEARVAIYHKNAEDHWDFRIFKGLDAVARIDSLNLHLPLKEIYEGIDLPPKTDD